MAGNLETTQSEKKVWLVKFPPMVAQRLHLLSAQEAGSQELGPAIGCIRHTRNATQVW